MIIVGIDAGSKGAIAFLDSESYALLAVYDIPVDMVQVGKHNRPRVARTELLSILNSARGAHVFVERPEGRPMRFTDKRTGGTESRQPGAAGMLSLGENYGCILMAATAVEMRLTEIRPGQWKRAIGTGAAKDDSIRRAIELFPAMRDRFARKKDDGRAEAALIAYYGAKSLKRGFERYDTDW